MKHNNILPIFLFSLALTWSGWVNADFESGMQAQRDGQYDTAFTEFKKAADNGEERAFGKLASMYLYGLGTTKDYGNAYIWFGLARHTGDKYAGKFQKAASSALTMKQLATAEEELTKLKAKYPAAKQ